MNFYLFPEKTRKWTYRHYKCAYVRPRTKQHSTMKANGSNDKEKYRKVAIRETNNQENQQQGKVT